LNLKLCAFIDVAKATRGEEAYLAISSHVCGPKGCEDCRKEIEGLSLHLPTPLEAAPRRWQDAPGIAREVEKLDRMGLL
jgi:hypothetical protein